MKMLSSFRTDPQAFLAAVHALWMPPHTASALHIRLHGARLYAVGVLCLLIFVVTGVGLSKLLDTPPIAALLTPLYFAALVLCVVGGYRLATGRVSATSLRGFSFWRMLVGLLAILAGFFICLLLIGWAHRLLDAWFPDQPSAEVTPPIGAGPHAVEDAIQRALEQIEQERVAPPSPLADSGDTG